MQIVFPNGSIDPWHALGIVKDVSSTEQAVFIEGKKDYSRLCHFGCQQRAATLPPVIWDSGVYIGKSVVLTERAIL